MKKKRDKNVKSKSKQNNFKLINLREKLKSLKNIHNSYWHDNFMVNSCRSGPDLPLPEIEMKPMVNLGCLNSTHVNDLVTVSLSIPYNTRSASIQDAVYQRLNQEYFNYRGNPRDLYNVDYTPFPNEETFNSFNRDFIGAAVYAPDVQVIDSNTQDPRDIYPVGTANLNTPYGYCYPNGICDFSGAGTYGDQSSPSTYPLFLSQERPIDNNNQLLPIENSVFTEFGVPTENIFGNVPNSVTSPAPYPWNGPAGTSGRTLPIAMQTPYQSTVYLNSSTNIYNQNNFQSYGSVELSQEGLIWTLWPLTRPKKGVDNEPSTYFSDFTFGTAIKSNYAIGQLAYFMNNTKISCVPFGGVNPGLLNASIRGSEIKISSGGGGRFNINDVDIQPDVIRGTTPTRTTGADIITGIQTLSSSLLLTTKQMVAVVVVKVTEQVARIPNPTSGVGSRNRFIYVGYDGWSVIRTSANPVSPMAAQVYNSPQTVTGAVTRENMQTIFPPNFATSILYKNSQRTAPTSTINGLFTTPPFDNSTTK